jgi:hypothetical protein
LNLQDPHISEPYGVLVKSQWQCNTAPATVHLDTPYTWGMLWVCPSQGPNDENWITSNCSYRGGDFDAIGFSSAGQIQTRYIPNDGRHAAGCCWWVACTQWYSSGVNGNGDYFLRFSNWKWINEP